MTEEPGNKYGSFYGNPGGVLPGVTPVKQGPDGHPCATLFAAPDESDAKAGGGGRKLFVFLGVVLLMGGAGAAFVALGGQSMLSPKAAHASESPEQAKAIDQAKALAGSLRTQLAQYRAEHDQQSPPLGRLQDEWGVLLRKTYADGSFAPENPGKFSPRLGEPLGPYLQQQPVNPLTNSPTVVAAGQATTGAGWTYDESTGKIWAVAPAESERVRLSSDYFELVKPAP